MLKCFIFTSKVKKKLSCRWQTTWCMCMPMLRSPWYKILQSTAFHVVLSRAALWWPRFIGQIFRLLPTPFPYDALNEGDSLELFISGMVKLEWLGYNLVRSHNDRLSHLDTIHQYDRHTDRQPRCHSKHCANTWRRAAKKQSQDQ